MGYTAGTLDLSILGTSDSAVASIEKTVKSLNSLSRSIQIFSKTDINKTFSKLAESINLFSQSSKNLDVSGFERLSILGTTGKGINSLANSINKLNSAQTVFATQQLSNLFEKLSITLEKLDATKLSNLSVAGKSLSSISNISKLNDLDWDKIGAGFSKLTTAITPFVEKVKEAEASLTALYGILNKSSSKKLGNMLGGSTQQTKIPSLLRWGSLTAVLYTARRLGSTMAKIVDLGGDFSETLNLWQVSMGQKFLPQATEFVNKMNEAYGISEKALMNYQAIFKNMLGSLGQISEQTAYKLSEGITQMALDYASLYNVKFEDAMVKFQAALAGQVRPIRSVAGYDITENTLFQLYQALGGTKTMRQLSRTEKQLLAIYAVFEQMDRSGAIGDLEKTLPSFANQIRIMVEGWDRVLTYSGLILSHLIQESGLLTYINAMLIFIGDTLYAIADSYGAMKSFADPFENITAGAIVAEEATDKLEKKLLDFDKFRSLSGVEEENDLPIDEKVVSALSEFDSILGGASSKAQELADKLKESSGLFDEEGVFQKDKWGELEASIKNVGSSILLAFGSVAVIKTLGSFAGIISGVWTNLTGITTALGMEGGIAGAFANLNPWLLAGIAIFALLSLFSEDFRESLVNIGGALKGIAGSETMESFEKLASWLGTLFESIANAFAMVLQAVAIPLLSVLSVILRTIASVVEAFDFLGDVFTGEFSIEKWNNFQQKQASIWTENWDFISELWEGTQKSWYKANTPNGEDPNELYQWLDPKVYREILSEQLDFDTTVLDNILGEEIKINIEDKSPKPINRNKKIRNRANSGEETDVSSELDDILSTLEELNLLYDNTDVSSSIDTAIQELQAINLADENRDESYSQLLTILKGIDLKMPENAPLPDQNGIFTPSDAATVGDYSSIGDMGSATGIQTFAQTIYTGSLKALNDWWGGSNAKNDIPQLEGVSETGLYKSVTGTAKQYGREWKRI